MTYYNMGWSTKAICEKINCSQNKGYKFIKKKGLKSHAHLPVVVNEKQISEIKERYLNGQTIQTISKEMSIKEGTVNYWLRKFKITRPNGKSSECNHDYFKNIDTPNKAYFLGLLFADGGIMSGKNQTKKTLSLELKWEDKYILEEFRKQLQASSEVKETKKEQKWEVNGKIYNITKHNAYFRITCKPLIDDLINWGCLLDKTISLKEIPNIPEEFKRFFLLGFYDGDGIVSVGKSAYMGFCGTKSMMESISNFLSETLNFKVKTPYYNKSNKIYYLQYGTQKEIDILFNYFYQNLEIPCLKRKLNKIKNYLYGNTEITQ